MHAERKELKMQRFIAEMQSQVIYLINHKVFGIKIKCWNSFNFWVIQI